MTTQRRSGRLQAKKAKFSDSGNHDDSYLDSDEEPRTRRFDRFKSERTKNEWMEEKVCDANESGNYSLVDSDKDEDSNAMTDENWARCNESELNETVDVDLETSESEGDSDSDYDSDSVSPHEDVDGGLSQKIRARLIQESRRAAVSLGTLTTFYKRIGATIPDVAIHLIDKEEHTIKLLCDIVTKRNSTKYKVAPYNSCEIGIIPPCFYEPTVSFRQILLKNFTNPDFKVKIFSDSSRTFGPCPYHEVKKFRQSSPVTALVGQGWHAYFMNKSWAEGASHDENKDNALFDQMRGKVAGAIRSLRKQTAEVAKVEWINKSLGNKGCRLDFTEMDVVETSKVAMYDGIPLFIENSLDEDWQPYDALAKDKVKDSKSTDQNEEDDDLDAEEFSTNESIDTLNLDKSQIKFWKDRVLHHANKEINICPSAREPSFLHPKTLMAVCLALNGSLSSRDAIEWLRQNLLIKPEKFDLLSRGKYHRALVNSSSMIGIESEPKWFHHRGRQWFHHNGHSSSALRLYSLDPKYADIVNAAISRWRLRYGIRIQEKLINKDLWGKILKLEVTSNNLMAIQQKCIDTSKLPTPSFVTKKYEKNTFSLKMNTELPFKYLIAVGLKQNGPMRTSEIMHWLSTNFEHLRHYGQGNNSAQIVRIKNSVTWFVDNGHRRSGSKWELIPEEEGKLDEELRNWRLKYKDQIEEETTNKEIVQFIFGI